MRETVVSAAAIGLPNSKNDCPVAALAREIKCVNDAAERMEMLAKQLTVPASDKNRGLHAALDDQRSAIEDQASRELARSGLGAILQVELMMTAADAIFSWVPEGGKAEPICHEFKDGITRMAYSVVSFIESATGAKAEDAASSYYLPRDENPHLGKAVFDANGLTKSENLESASDDAARGDEAAHAVDSTIEIDEDLSVRALSAAIQISENFLNRVSAARFGVTDDESNALMRLINVASTLLRKTPARRPADIAGKIAVVLNDLRGCPLLEEMLQSAINDCLVLDTKTLKSADAGPANQ